MINLLVAAIISDYDAMKDEVDEENLYFIAEYMIEREKCERVTQRWLQNHFQMLQNTLPDWILKMILTPDEKRKAFVLQYCPHLICKCGLEVERLPIPRPGSIRYNPRGKQTKEIFCYSGYYESE